MSKKFLKQLIKYSYKKNILNYENVSSVAKLLKRIDLKHYIEALKKQERKLSVFIDVPINDVNIKDKFRKIFPNKKVVWNIEPSLMLGTRIIDDDMLFEMNLKNTLDKIKDSIDKDYD
ncbi:MAG: hypothetical protein AAB583_03225 [Patescibacteria group bacterium]